MSVRPLNVAVAGLGVMGRTHVAAYRAADAAGFPCRLVAVCDADPRARAGLAPAGGNITAVDAPLFDLAQVRAHETVEQLAADPGVDAVSVCTPTDAHVAAASVLLRGGKHVLVEKPVSLRAPEIRALDREASRAGRLCMPAMCMRFWQGWDWLAARIRDGSLGPVRSAVFTRLGARPAWSRGFYLDPARSGGALRDLHVHDADFVSWVFGTPDAVVSAGGVDQISTIYRYATGPRLVVAEGGWVASDGFPFRMRYTVEFERAVADFDLARDPIVLLTREGRTEPVAVSGLAGYDGEIRAFLEAISGGAAEPPVTLDQAAEVMDLLDAEQRSAETGREVAVRKPG